MQVTSTVTPAATTRRSEPIPGYVLRERIGAGGYGEVWSAEAPGGLVKAIKFVYGLMDESRAAREFKSLGLIKGVRHPFLLSLERIEILEGQLLIVTELADGSLKERFEECVKNGQVGIPREELLAHLHDAADALDYMNSHHSLQHLDVKPENLLLVGGRIKVADFGLVKEIQEVSASLMGGLTPIYAPPEVFDARPSRRSDQYSLAIVYQEMLTGVLPFPGKTPAQLATQHLTARPRLNPLSEPDQAVIARALAKDPLKRFDCCRDMIEALLHPHDRGTSGSLRAGCGDSAQGGQAAGMHDGPALTELAAYAANNQPVSPEQDMFRRVESAEQAMAYESQGRYDAAEQAAHEAISSETMEVRYPSTPLVDLPPLEVDLNSSTCRPTLFVGIGGLAGKTLQQFRRKLADRGEAKTGKHTRFLLLDTDANDLLETTQNAGGTAFTATESLALPLRKSSDYRNDSQRYLDWLSRRWLFNIPRSQQTEGIRPLGRLAFVDHAAEVMRRLREAISRLPELDKSTEEKAPPRVVIVSSSSGGAASGMVLDVVFAARQIIDEQKLGGTVDLLLLHGTGRQPAAQELASVNTFSLLTEVSQCLRVGGSYPGDFSCGLKSRPASDRAVENMYLIHLGQDLGHDQFLAGCDRVAEYLYLDAATPAGKYLSDCRTSEPQEKRQDLVLRTFGLHQIGFSESAVNRGVESLCRATVLGWYGEPMQKQAPSLSARLADSRQDVPDCSQDSKNAELELLVSEQMKGLGLELDSVVERIFLLAKEDLGGMPEVAFRKIIQETPLNAQKFPPVDRWFAGSARYFGTLGSDLDSSSQSPLQSALVNRQAKATAPLGPQLRDWLLALPESPAVRVFGGQWCAKWFRTHFKNMVEKAREMRARFGLQLQDLEQKLSLAAKSPTKSLAKNKEESGTESLFLLHCQVRLYQLAAHIAMQYAQNMSSYVTQAHDQLHDLGRDIKHMANQFAATELTSEDVVELAAWSQLRGDEAESTAKLDKFVQESIFSSGGFRAVLLGGEQRSRLMAQLRQQARQLVLGSLRLVNLSSLVKELGKTDSNESSQLGRQLETAQPWLQQVGGERRLLYVSASCGEEARGLSPEEIALLVGSARFQQLPAVIPSAVGQVVFCYEIGNVPLAHAAAKLIENQPSYAEAASRLHTRSDISWQKLALHADF